VLASSIVETETGFGINLSEAETLCSRETAARKALMEVPTGAVYGIRGIRLPGGEAPADAVFCVTDNAAMRKATGLVMGTLWFKESGADRVEGESASLSVEYLSGWGVIGGDMDPEDVPGFAADWLALSP
jgi:hypothetical protein